MIDQITNAAGNIFFIDFSYFYEYNSINKEPATKTMKKFP